jgi:hypothetical protein
MVPLEDPFLCPACGATVPAAGSCKHLLSHEETPWTAPVSEEIRELFVRTVRAHDRMCWLGQCFCGADNPKMRGADR